MVRGGGILHCHQQILSTHPLLALPCNSHQVSKPRALKSVDLGHQQWRTTPRTLPPLKMRRKRAPIVQPAAALPTPQQPLDLTEDNVRLVLADARLELSQLFDDSVGITGQAELAELDGPFVKISLKGRFWHKRSTVVARLGNYLKQRIPEILEVDIEDEKQLDDSPENF